MNKNKINVLGILVFFIMNSVIISCSNDDSVIVKKSNFSSSESNDMSARVGSVDFNLDYLLGSKENIAQQKLENKRMANLKDYSDSPKITYSNDRVVFLLEKEKLSISESDELSAVLKSIGFMSIEECGRYAKSVLENTNVIVNKTNYLEKKEDVKIEVFESFYRLPAGGGSGGGGSGACENQQSACINQADAIHTVGVVTCTGASLGIALGSAGWATWGAVLFQSACIGANLNLYVSSSELCQANYAVCIQ